MNSRLRSILLIGLIVILAGAAIFIGYQISIRQQAPDDAAAAWCTGNPASGATECPVGQPVDYSRPLCIVWDWRENTSQCGTTGLGECYEKNTCAAPGDGTGNCKVSFSSSLTGDVIISNCGTNKSATMKTFWRNAPKGSSDASCIGTIDNEGSRQVGNGTYAPRNDSVGCGKCVQYDVDPQDGVDGSGGVSQYTGDCKETPPTTVTCYRCTAITTDGEVCESFTQTGTTCPAGSSTSPTGCGAVATGGQCTTTTTNPTTCWKCTTSETDGNSCESYQIGAGSVCSATGGYNTQAECQNRLPTDPQCPVKPADDGNLTLIKSSSEVCEAGTNNHVLNYAVIVTNISGVTINHEPIVDTLQGITGAVISNISDSGVASGGNKVTWPAGTLAAGASKRYSYTVLLTQAQGDAIGDVLNNAVQVSYTSGTLKQLSYTNNQRLACDASDLPKTALADDMIWILAIALIFGGVLLYRTEWGQQLLLNMSAGVENTVNPRKARKAKFEKELLEKAE